MNNGSSYTHAGMRTVAERPIICTPVDVLQAFVHNTHAGMGLADNCPQHKVKRKLHDSKL